MYSRPFFHFYFEFHSDPFVSWQVLQSDLADQSGNGRITDGIPGHIGRNHMSSQKGAGQGVAEAE